MSMPFFPSTPTHDPRMGPTPPNDMFSDNDGVYFNPVNKKEPEKEPEIDLSIPGKITINKNGVKREYDVVITKNQTRYAPGNQADWNEMAKAIKKILLVSEEYKINKRNETVLSHLEDYAITKNGLTNNTTKEITTIQDLDDYRIQPTLKGKEKSDKPGKIGRKIQKLFESVSQQQNFKEYHPETSHEYLPTARQQANAGGSVPKGQRDNLATPTHAKDQSAPLPPDQQKNQPAPSKVPVKQLPQFDLNISKKNSKKFIEKQKWDIDEFKKLISKQKKEVTDPRILAGLHKISGDLKSLKTIDWDNISVEENIKLEEQLYSLKNNYLNLVKGSSPNSDYFSFLKSEQTQLNKIHSIFDNIPNLNNIDSVKDLLYKKTLKAAEKLRKYKPGLFASKGKIEDKAVQEINELEKLFTDSDILKRQFKQYSKAEDVEYFINEGIRVDLDGYWIVNKGNYVLDKDGKEMTISPNVQHNGFVDEHNNPILPRPQAQPLHHFTPPNGSLYEEAFYTNPPREGQNRQIPPRTNLFDEEVPPLFANDADDEDYFKQ